VAVQLLVQLSFVAALQAAASNPSKPVRVPLTVGYLGDLETTRAREMQDFLQERFEKVVAIDLAARRLRTWNTSVTVVDITPTAEPSLVGRSSGIEPFWEPVVFVGETTRELAPRARLKGVRGALLHSSEIAVAQGHRILSAQVDVPKERVVEDFRSGLEELQFPRRAEIIRWRADLEDSRPERADDWGVDLEALTDTPDIELIGLTVSDIPRAVLWREGNIVHFGCGASPLAMTEAGRSVLVNTIVEASRRLEWAITIPLDVAEGRLPPLDLAEPLLEDARALGVDPTSTEGLTALAKIVQSRRGGLEELRARRLLDKLVSDGPGGFAHASVWSSWWRKHEPFLFFSRSLENSWRLDWTAMQDGLATRPLRGSERVERLRASWKRVDSAPAATAHDEALRDLEEIYPQPNADGLRGLAGRVDHSTFGQASLVLCCRWASRDPTLVDELIDLLRDPKSAEGAATVLASVELTAEQRRRAFPGALKMLEGQDTDDRLMRRVASPELARVWGSYVLQLLRSNPDISNGFVLEELLALGGTKTLEATLTVLDQDEQSLETAVRALAAFGSRAASPLVKRLANLDPERRWRALVALASLGHDGEATWLALARVVLTEQIPRLRYAACYVGYRQGRSGLGIVQRGLGDSDPAIRRASAQLLGMLGVIASPSTQALATALEDRDPSVRREVARALRQIGSGAREAKAALLRASRDDHPDVRYWAVEALEAVEPTPTWKLAANHYAASRPAALEPSEVPNLLLQLESEDDALRLSAARELARGAIAQLQAQAQEAEPEAAARAALHLARIGGEIDARIRWLANYATCDVVFVDDEMDDQAWTVRELADFGPAALAAIERELLVFPRFPVGPVSFFGYWSALRQIGDRGIPALATSLNHWFVGSRYAVRLLALFGPPAARAVPAIVARWRAEGLLERRDRPSPASHGYQFTWDDDDEGDAAPNRIDGQGMAGRDGSWRRDVWRRFGRAAVPYLLEAMGDPAWIVRSRAAAAFGAIGTNAREAVPALLTMFGSPKEDRVAAAVALGRIGVDRPQMDTIRAALANESTPALEVAASELQRRFAPNHRVSLERCLEALDDADLRVRLLAVRELLTLGEVVDRAVPALGRLVDAMASRQRARWMIPSIQPALDALVACGPAGLRELEELAQRHDGDFGFRESIERAIARAREAKPR
jgi:HEAT repeat protein